ncbi:enoyl-CoA hydratase [Roseomonas terrae]|jgi:enoyl-CoA hydratase/carnithine racemase|uniref:Enoyl-CoA hydratase n=1 Tax=Neoroseomonas terrae TaxID=424799 RepID=A0ABS5EF49_9PROT|nr:enoyl-CoA hydratase [Neoroseomonas terrae]MBR0649645.1 enoyl-CoA hydratase [Neoroseomonas terrae]
MSGIVVTDAEGLRTIRIDRPEKKNALTRAMYGAMADALRDAATAPGVRVVFITGGDACFTSGNDVADFKARGEQQAEVPSPAREFLAALRACPKPVVAAVAGYAIGIGTTLLLHCDLVYAADTAVFRMPFVDLGLCPEGGSSLVVPQRAGQLLANELLMLGEAFTPETALRAGIANAVVPLADLFTVAEGAARKLATKPPTALAATKRLLRQAEETRLTTHMVEEFSLFGALLRGPEAAEAVAAFQEKRKPDFSRFLAAE